MARCRTDSRRARTSARSILAEDAAKRFPNQRFAQVSQVRPYAIPLAAGLMFAVAVAVRLWLTRDIAAPWIMTDELFYSELAASGRPATS